MSQGKTCTPRGRSKMKPRVGITSIHKLESSALDAIADSIDLTFERARLDETKRLTEENPRLDEYEIDALVDEKMECFETDSWEMLWGAWEKNDHGKYIISPSKGEFAATYNSDTGIVCVEYSIYTAECHHTSPCYVMSDGSGPCGDLDTKGNSVVAYTLPPEYFSNKETYVCLQA
jgi:hypothetical protein